MSIAELLPAEQMPAQADSPEDELAYRLVEEGAIDSIYRPDIMTESFAHRLKDALGELGVETLVVGTYLKGIHSQQGTSFALEPVDEIPDNVIQFPRSS